MSSGTSLSPSFVGACQLAWSAAMAFERLRLRGLSGARDEFLLAATVQNLRRLAKLAPKPPPDETSATA
jgi:hypothetical protein